MELCATLEVYLEQAKSLAKAAEVLFIHRNTVRYRINKCMELMNTDLEDGNEIFAYILSLRILEYDKKFPMKHDGRTDRAEE
jgi:DNA-binding PucR family transcriptional regulator